MMACSNGFNCSVYPDHSQSWQYVDRPPNSVAINGAERLYGRLVHLDAANPLRFRFSTYGQELFVTWLPELEGKLRGDNLHPALVAHLSKYRSLMPTLALLFELADGGTEAVSLAHAQQAAEWCDYLESHARRVYSMLISPERAAAAELGRHLTQGWKRAEGLFTVREVYRNEWRGLSTPDDVRRVLPLLLDAGWLRPADVGSQPGRPSELYLINPRIYQMVKP
jgi:putative DNA primase/helicase